jgi:hypothetical protein
MRCSCCDRALSDYESTLKHAVTNKYLDTCTKCLEDTGIPLKGRKDLLPKNVDDDFDDLMKELKF